MRATYPIITCDHESGCDQWTTDEYTALVANWRDFLDGWQYDPYDDNLPHLCPEHRPAEPAAEPIDLLAALQASIDRAKANR